MRVKSWIKQREGKTGNVYLGVPHRLDRPASGALVLARPRAGGAAALRAVRRPAGEEDLWACVSGAVTPEAGTWVDFLYKVPGEPRAQVAKADESGAREAVLHYRVLSRHEWGTCWKLSSRPVARIRFGVQAASRGHAVLGDSFYGATIPFGPPHEDERMRAIARCTGGRSRSGTP